MIAFFALLTGCGPKVMFIPGLNFIQSKEYAAAEIPEKLQAKLKTTAYRGKEKTGFTTLLSAIPHERYRLEFKGPLGNHMGDLYWVKDSLWTLYVPSEDIFFQDSGTSFQLPHLTLDSLDINLVFGFLWGQLASPGIYRVSPPEKGKIQALREDGRGALTLDSKSGQVVRTLSGKYRLEYDKYSEMNGQVIPKEVTLYREGERLLTLETKKVKTNFRWKRSPFHIQGPEG